MVTHEDMLQNPHDEDLWEYYATSQLAIVDLATGKTTPVGKAGIIDSARIAPDGRYLLVTTIHRPFSYLHQYREFPKEIEVWDRAGTRGAQGGQPAARRQGADQRRSHRPAQRSMAAERARHAPVGGGARRRRPEEPRAEPRPHRVVEGAVHRRPARSLQNRAALLRHTDGRQGRHGPGGGFRTAYAPRADLRDRSGQTRRAAPDLEPQ